VWPYRELPATDWFMMIIRLDVILMSGTYFYPIKFLASVRDRVSF
jgi:hypothetical protein